MSRLYKVLILGVVLMFLFILLFPIPKANKDYSSLLLSKDGQFLAAEVANDEQWRLPNSDNIPVDFSKAIVLFEDEYYYYHPGFNPISIVKAIYINIRKGRIVRGASTISMQLLRIRNRHKKRTYLQKMYELLGAIKLEILNSKKSILNMWASEAPYGGNIVGAEMASWKYFDRPLQNLSWAEYALLAILPNNPSHANLWKNTQILLQKRNTLLKKLSDNGAFRQEDLELHTSEPLATPNVNKGQRAYHALRYLKSKYNDQHRFLSTIDFNIQTEVEQLVNEEAIINQIENINNAAVVVLDVQSNELLAYVGNVKNSSGQINYVDIVQSPRSYGSLLKPLLYAYSIDKGLLLPTQMVADIPTNISGFRPKNFDKKFRGASRLDEMVQQSLNIPAVRVLNMVGLNEFYNWLSTFKLKFLNKGVQQYGLSLILGGGESNLWGLTNSYKGIGRRALEMSKAFNEVDVIKEDKKNNLDEEVNLSAWSAIETLEVMAEVERPQKEKYWHYLDQDRKIAWKTGTSYGHRDAWAIGLNSNYAVGVWVGNESGVARKGLTGIVKAAPILFKIFARLKGKNVFKKGEYYGEQIRECEQSGMLAGPLCKKVMLREINRGSHQLDNCHYHVIIGYNKNNDAVEKTCPESIRQDTFFRLPPIMEYYYTKSNLNYKLVPAIEHRCSDFSESALSIIYPSSGMNIFVPRELNKREQSIVASAHANQKDTLFWFLNNDYLGLTTKKHEVQLDNEIGQHELLVVSSSNKSYSCKYNILPKD